MRTNTEIINPFNICEKWWWAERCCINSASWTEFTKCYIEATKMLAEELKAKEGACIFHPIAFMLRHSIELTIKNELITKCWKTRDELLPLWGKLKTHSLESLWCNLKQLSDDLHCDTSLWNYIRKEEIELFDKCDKGSYEFRYPIRTDWTTSCENLCCFWLNEVIEICNNLEDFLNSEYPQK